MNTRRRCTAFHEAGHVLAFWWNGQPIQRVTVRQPEEAAAGPMVDLRGHLQPVEGLVEAEYFVLHPALIAQGIAEYLPSMVESIERDLIDCFAGPVAEAVYRHSQSDTFLGSSGRGDRQRGHQLISLLPARMLLDAESLAINRANHLVRRYWPALTAVANRLHEQGSMSGEAINLLLREVTGETPKRRANNLASLDR